MTSAALLDLAARVATNTLTVVQQNALAQALLAIAPTFPNPDDSSAAIAPPDEADAREWIAALYAIQSLSGGVSPLAPTLLLTVPNLAALAALSTTSLADGSEAFVQTVGAYYTLESLSTLAPDGITVIAAAAGGNWLRTYSAITEQAVLQTAWFVDRQNVTGTASDENTGLTSGTALRTKNEIIRRWGTNAPVLSNVTVTITYLSADPDEGDPGIFQPFFVNKGALIHTAPLPAPAFTGTLLAVTAKNRAANQELRSTFTATTGAIATGMLLVNTTRGNSRAFVGRNIGAGVFQITQPLAPYVPPAGIVYTEVDTWANTDAILGYVLPNINLDVIGGVFSDFDATFGPNHIVQQIAIPTLATFGVFTVDFNSGPAFFDCNIARPVQGNGGVQGNFNGCFLGGQVFVASNGTQTIIFAGGIISTSACNLVGCQLRSDLIIRITGNNAAFVFNLLANVAPVIPPLVFLDATPLILVGDAQLGACVFYGSGSINKQSGQANFTGLAATAFPLTGGLLLDGVATGYSNATAAGVTTVHGGIALTPANLDAAAGAAGFGGLAYAGSCAFSKAGVQP